jgi:hypothetical protein
MGVRIATSVQIPKPLPRADDLHLIEAEGRGVTPKPLRLVNDSRPDEAASD